MKMNLNIFTIGLLFLCFLNSFTAGTDNPTHFTGDVSINCGSTGTSAARNGREWLGDEPPNFSSLLHIKGSSTTSSIIHKSISADPIPHKTARISRSQFSYSFQVNRGQKILRLRFNPVTYWGFNRFRDLFTVEVGPFTLLSNFSASLTADALDVHSFAKEFCLNIEENQQLTTTFSPESSKLLDTYAFINGIEIISVPSTLYYFHDSDIDYSSALEIIHRQNFKLSSVLLGGDFDDLFPTWTMRKGKEIKYNTWKISVDVGFRYLIRLHLSELGLKLAVSRDVIFKFLINEMNAHTNMVKESDDNGILWYRDYMVVMRGHKKEGKRYLSIFLQAYNESIDEHGLLAGFEILKLSNPDNSLASPNPSPPKRDSPSHTLRTLLSLLGDRNSIATVIITITVLVNIIVHKVREVWEAGNTEEENKPSARAERFCRRFPLAEIQLATRNFSDAFVIGMGGFGNVYKGLIDNGQETVAIKRLKSTSRQGAHEFLTEIETLSELRHVNLLSLIGYCNEHGEMILVYEYVACGTLVDHIYKLARGNSNCSNLTWKQRLNICIGAGRGLNYLHTGHRVIHRDVKASNILLDENFEAKVSDFGLAKPEDRSKLESHVSTNVKGTFGYFDPDYVRTRRLTRKTDTYAFGVVLMVILCGRPALDRRLGVAEEERNLTEWTRDKISKGEVDQIVASSLKEEISPDSLKTFVSIAQRCLCDEPKKRPKMSEVVLQLEFALEQQEIKRVLVPNEIATNLSAKEGQLTIASTQVQNLTPPHTERTSNKMANAERPFGKKDGRVGSYKSSRLRPWDTFRNRVKPSKKSGLLLSGISLCGLNRTDKISNSRTSGSSLPLLSDLYRHFLLEEIKSATGNFDDNFVIGEGGYGKVYKGFIPDASRSGSTTVAIKRLKRLSWQGAPEFRTEIEMLPKLRHLNLVSLIGYCNENGEMILVYDYLARGTLRDHLYNTENPPLPWSQRLGICIGAAKGLHYLHSGAKLPIIHRDVKTANILLDETWVPKVADFGLSKVGPTDMDHTHVSTGVAGTYGYWDPEYIMSGQLRDRSDVYSFGVVLLEVLCARPAIMFTTGILKEEQVNLASWARTCYRRGTIDQIIDPNLERQIRSESLSKFVETAIMCIRKKGIERPTMRHVVWSLEFAMQLQENRDGHVEADGVLNLAGLTKLTINLSLMFAKDTKTFITKAKDAEKDLKLKRLYLGCEIDYQTVVDFFGKAQDVIDL
ncbi:hypothetical protein BUALT_Bualt08G0109200 [Buddleja alternifolia]|uniref:Protein kinase domain-containing protein n=1 Tax=Buddleja alternifolia TaxID=168488 RepID=A0AAV6X4T6_9LAMI|nr:hypothetical protein BUALT_Bualt08G0109200 [Buddleja alternifolia]